MTVTMKVQDLVMYYFMDSPKGIRKEACSESKRVVQSRKRKQGKEGERQSSSEGKNILEGRITVKLGRGPMVFSVRQQSVNVLT